MRTVALDLGARRVDFCEITKGGVVERGVVGGVSQLQTRLGPTTPPARVAFEACREGWYVAQRLSGWGHEPVMVDTTRVRQLGIGQHGRKNDRIDAEVLATALLTGRIPQAHILSAGRQKLRMELSVRRSLVATRAQYVTSIRGIVRAHGASIPECRTSDFLGRLEGVALDQQAQQLIEPLRVSLEVLTRQIAEIDLRIEELCEQEPVIRRLMTAPCVGSVVAASFVSVIDEARRFRNAHQVESYLGLVPSEDSTGGRRRWERSRKPATRICARCWSSRRGRFCGRRTAIRSRGGDVRSRVGAARGSRSSPWRAGSRVCCGRSGVTRRSTTRSGWDSRAPKGSRATHKSASSRRKRFRPRPTKRPSAFAKPTACSRGGKRIPGSDASLRTRFG